MGTTIAHLSDIHFERHDTSVSDRLTEALKRERPHIMVASGDFADQFWHVEQGRKWLLDLCAACGMDAASNLIVVPGNHDYGWFGIAGFKPLTGIPFRKQFPHWNRPRIAHFKEHGVTFFKIDSNPMTLKLARGRIRSRQLRKLELELEGKTSGERSAIKGSTKIVVVHHHPFPVPYEGGDTFLMLKNAQSFIQFLAEQEIDMVLHGHKHRAPHSLLELGTCGERNRVIEVVGAGTAITKVDREARGNNFNLITIEDSGLRYVRQFFALPGESFREIRSDKFLSNAFEFSYRRALACKYKVTKVHWDLQLAEDGDGFDEISYEGVSPVDGAKLESIDLPAWEVEVGHLSPAVLDERRSSQGVRLVSSPEDSQQPEGEGPRKLKLNIRFDYAPTEGSPAHFVLLSHDRNAFAMNSTEFKEKYPGREDGLEWAQKKISDPVEEFSCALSYPAGFRPERPPRFDVFSVGKSGASSREERHEWLTRVLEPNFHYSSVLNAAFISIRKPPTGYYYRISWEVPKGQSRADADLPGKFRSEQFRKSLLRLRELITSPPKPDTMEHQEWQNTFKQVHETLNQALATFVEAAARRIAQAPGFEGVLNSYSLDADKLDITLMVCDDSAAGQPKLRIVAGACKGNPNYWNFNLAVGDGNAGWAYKKKMILPFDKEKEEQDPGSQRYVRIPGAPSHEMLYSIPLIDARSRDLVFGVVNFGTFSPQDARLLRVLADNQSLEWMANQVQSYVLQKLLESLKIS